MTLIPLDKQRRLKDKEDLKKKTKILMDLKRVNEPNKHQTQSNESFNDLHMKDALAKVRKSGATIDTNLSRYNGTYLYTESQKNSELEKTLQDLENEVMNDLEKEFPSKKKKTKFVDPVLTKVEPSPSKKTIKENLTWKRICEQIDKPRWQPSTSTLFGGLRNTSARRDRISILESILEED